MITALNNYAIAFANWRYAVWLGIRQAANEYSGGSKLSTLMALLEPVIIVTGLYVFRGLFKEHLPNFGTSLYLFYSTGFLPYYFFIRISSRARSTSTQPRYRLPGLTALDLYFSAVALNSIIWITMMGVIFFVLWLNGIDQARPVHVAECVTPIVLLLILGMGVGMINNVVSRFVSFWSRLYAILTRGLVFMSGVVMIVDLTPPWLRLWSVANPISHALEWFRLGFYGRYPHNSLDKAYLVKWALIALFLGLILDRAALRKLDDT